MLRAAAIVAATSASKSFEAFSIPSPTSKRTNSITEFLEHSNIEERRGTFTKNVEESLTRVLEIFHYLDGLYQKALDVTDAEGDDVTNDIFVGAKAELEKNIWMVAAELGQEPGL